MELKTSTVKQVSGDGTHEDKYGLKYDFEIVMENGDVGQYSSKTDTQTKFKQGKEVTYEFYPGKFPKIKPHYAKPDANLTQTGQRNDNVQLYIIRQSSLKIALDYHNITMDNPKNLTRDDVAETSEFFTQYVMNGLEKVTRIEAELPEEGMKMSQDDNMDLPF